MLFKAAFWDGIRDGTVTCTVRAWASARVHVGRRYKVAAIGSVEIDAVDRVALAEIGENDARACGFGSRDALVSMLAKAGRTPLDDALPVYRVRFHYVGVEPEPEVDLSAKGVAAVIARLDAIDRRSKRGPWTRRVLRLIGERPGIAAGLLAPEVGREKQAFKRDVRTLKKHGLTESLETGYRLSALGLAVTAHLDGRHPILSLIGAGRGGGRAPGARDKQAILDDRQSQRS